MEIELIIVIAAFAAVILGLLFGASFCERQYHRRHPPDDGTREERFDEDD